MLKVLLFKLNKRQGQERINFDLTIISDKDIQIE